MGLGIRELLGRGEALLGEPFEPLRVGPGRRRLGRGSREGSLTVGQVEHPDDGEELMCLDDLPLRERDALDAAGDRCRHARRFVRVDHELSGELEHRLQRLTGDRHGLDLGGGDDLLREVHPLRQLLVLGLVFMRVFTLALMRFCGGACARRRLRARGGLARSRGRSDLSLRAA